VVGQGCGVRTGPVSIRRHRAAINETLTSGTGNALVESTNTKRRVIHRRAYGFRTPEAMIALGMLALGGLCPPTRTAPSPRGRMTTPGYITRPGISVSDTGESRRAASAATSRLQGDITAAHGHARAGLELETGNKPRTAHLCGFEGDEPRLMIDVDVEYYLKFVLSWT